MLGIPLLENRKVSWFLGVLFFGVLVLINYEVSISCFLEDIDLIPKIFKILLDGSSSFSVPRLFDNCQHCGFPNC